MNQDAPAGLSMERVAGFAVAPTSEGEGVTDLRGTWSLEPTRSGEEALR